MVLTQRYTKSCCTMRLFLKNLGTFIYVNGDLRMKKSLIALAALATVATAAQAQSSVTVYGIIDAGVSTVSNVKIGTTTTSGTVTGLSNGGLSTPRIGFRGVEDLGNGLKASFNLESEFLADNGSQASNDNILFGRAAWVGLSGNFGDVKLGRQNTLLYATGVAFDPLGGNNLGGFIAAGNYGTVRAQNAVTYTTPTVAGLTLAAQTGTTTAANGTADNEVAGNFTANRITSVQLSYAQAAFAASAILAKTNNSSGTTATDYSGIYASYDFGIAKALAGTVQTSPVTVTATSKIRHSFVGVQAPVAANTKVNLIAQQVKNQASGTTPKVYATTVVYSLSKRTDLYGVAAKSQQDGNSTQTLVNSGKFDGFSGTVAGQNQTGLSVGIRHSF